MGNGSLKEIIESAEPTGQEIIDAATAALDEPEKGAVLAQCGIALAIDRYTAQRIKTDKVIEGILTDIQNSAQQIADNTAPRDKP